MVLLSVGAAVICLGFVGWILGTIFNYHGIATIGAVIVVGVGVMVMTDGLEYKTGEIEKEVDNSTVEKTNTYQTLDTPTNLPFGALITLLGGVLVIRSLESLGDI